MDIVFFIAVAIWDISFIAMYQKNLNFIKTS